MKKILSLNLPVFFLLTALWLCAPALLWAQSGPITLICTPQVGQGDPVQLILDEAKGTALFSNEPSATATFNDTTVWWEIDSQDILYNCKVGAPTKLF
jgi:hypothetical protein